ncbi:hypothetical protein EW093_10095 [Thiospirochaeta perfilievii]|uniref:DUF2817 domain-containing protein n=1 Tax=Thiospirochaeta perfilievii TaxID=252967 RepID=A0A5C1QEA0_9SPIO|nr:murein peptide amidase A [Thiospirochaeta perfilievii]QEN05044.1 hypothetical protein EW093_10095 [Thiospirochaeta perfilievii]
MKIKLLFILLSLSQLLFSQESLGLDSGKRDILLFNNGVDSNRALLIIAGIHGDERETVTVANFLKDTLNGNKTIYFIPSVNPTLYSKEVNRRGYLREQLDSRGYIKDGSDLTKFNKTLYYRIFYGNQNTYINGIDHYVDPNRDFINRVLPTTKVLIDLIDRLLERHSELIILSLHGYMSGGRVYPEYKITRGNNFIVESRPWEIAQLLGKGIGYKPEMMYSPAIPILDRFKGEFIAYTGKIDRVIALDIELDSDSKNNSQRVLNGINSLLNYLDKE